MRGHPAELLSAYVDGELASHESSLIAEHLAECPTCRETVDDLAALRRLLGALTAPAAHPMLLPRTLARLDRHPIRSVPLRPLVAAAALAAALVIALQARPLPPPTTAEARDWYFQSHALLSEIHPMTDVSLTSFLSTSLPYEAPRR